jgi:hypothetical protein
MIKFKQTVRKNLGPYLKHFFFVTYEWAQKARVFNNTRLEMLDRDKHSDFLGPLINYKRK